MKGLFTLSFFSIAPLILLAQNVGIGTANPQEKLSVVTSTGFGISHQAGAIKMATYIDGSGGWIGTVTNHPFYLYSNNSAAQFTLLPNGNVGLGNINPQYRLDIIGRMRIRTGTVGNSYTASGIWMDDFRDGSPRIFLGMQDSIRMGIWGDGTPGVGWAFNFNARNGNVGIGLANPTSKLEVAGTITANDYKYPNAKTFYYAIPAAAFTPTSWSNSAPTNPATYYIEYNGDPSVYSGGNEFVAPVNLPDGATITGITIYYVDNNAEQDIKVVLRKRLHGSDNYYLMATLQSSGTPGNTQTATTNISDPYINNNFFNHTLTFQSAYYPLPASSLKLKSVRISYTMDGVQ